MVMHKINKRVETRNTTLRNEYKINGDAQNKKIEHLKKKVVITKSMD